MMIMTPAASTLIPVTVAISGSSSVMSAACVAFVVPTIIVVNVRISVVEQIRTTFQHCMQYIPVVDGVTVTRDSPTAATLSSVPLPLTMSWAVTLYTPEGRPSTHPMVTKP